MIEAQIEHFLNAFRYVKRHGVRWLEPRREAQDAFVADVDRKMARTVWTTGGYRSWYLDATGRNSTLWPEAVSSFRRRVGPFRPPDYHLRIRAAVTSNPAPSHVHG